MVLSIALKAHSVELDSKSTSVRMKAAKHPVSEELMAGPGKNLFNFTAPPHIIILSRIVWDFIRHSE